MAAVEGVPVFGKTLQKDAPIDVEEIQRKEGQSRDPVHISVSVPLESQLRHEKVEKGKTVSPPTFFKANRDWNRRSGSRERGEHFRGR